MRAWWIGTLVGAGVAGTCATWAVGCGSSSCEETQTCGATPGEGGPDADGSAMDSPNDGPGIDAPPGCDLTKEPKDSPACIDDGVGVFVDASKGVDAAAGTKAAPVKTIKAALEKAGAKRVYVCEGSYPENVKVTAANSIYGGFACTTWARTAAKAKVTSPSAAPALRIEKVTGEVVIADLALSSADAAKGESSVAVVVDTSTNVKLARVEIVAGNGGEGNGGAPGATASLTSVSSGGMNLNGNAAPAATTPGALKTCTFSNAATSTGAAGGAPGGTGSGGTPNLGGAAPNDGAGGAGNITCNPTGFGHNGTDAPAATPPAAITSRGKLTPQGWEATTGNDGAAGSPGQGGGGGGGRDGTSAGGGGGCGGPPGTGGKGGQGGGASIGLLSLDSNVSLVATTITTAAGGLGGTGGGGGAGSAGGGAGGGGPVGCAGGEGGKGGDGAPGGGGAGGISVGVLHKGPGKAGDKGVGGTPGVADGVDGTSAKIADVTTL